jgi:iron complex transport system permease protein
MSRTNLARWLLVIATLGLIVVISAGIAALVGPSRLGVSPAALLEDLRKLVAGQELSAGGVIFWQVRLPRILLAAIVGAALSVSGASFQAILRNPLADPFLLGVSGGGALGAIIAMLLGLDAGRFGLVAVPLFAFAGSLATVLLVFSLARTEGRLPVHSLLLAGVVANAFISAVIMFVLSLSSPERVQGVVFWMMGSIGSERWILVAGIGLYVLLAGAVLFSLARDFNLISLGEEPAGHLGVAVEPTKLWAFVAASLATGAVVSVTGIIGFAGLIVPHLCRLSLGPDHRLLIPASFLAGAVFLILCDTVARTLVAPAEMPVGVVTALLGGPFFIWLLRRRRDAALGGA